MSRSDLTRWNRAGLSRFHYVDGNAATHLEALRSELADRFGDWQAVQDSSGGQTPEEERQHMLRQYSGERREWAWEITRAFARALHTLTEHIDAFANEGYLKTATQWDSLRMLSAMVGYTPRPASSASTPLVVIAPDDGPAGVIEAGLQLKNEPEDGSPPVTFETLEDVEVSPALNGLRLKGWDFNNRVFAPFTFLWPLPDEPTLSVGQPAILFGTTSLVPAVTAVSIAGIDTDEAALEIGHLPPLTSAGAAAMELVKGDARLAVSPASVLTPRLNGPRVIYLDRPHGLSPGAIVAWTAGGGLTFRRVTRADATAIEVDAAGLPGTGDSLFAARKLTWAQFEANRNEWRLPLAEALPRSGAFRFVSGASDGSLGDIHELTADDSADATSEIIEEDGEPVYHKIKPARVTGAREIHFADPGSDSPVGFVAAPPDDNVFAFDGDSSGIVSGDWLVAEDAGGNFKAVRIDEIADGGEGYTVVFNVAPSAQSILCFHGPMQTVIAPADFDRNQDVVASGDLILALPDGAGWPDQLKTGRLLVLESDMDHSKVVAARILGADPESDRITIDTRSAEAGDFTAGELVIRGNVVMAGHGESRPAKILGSGDAARQRQSFVLAVDGVSHIADPLLPGGIRAAISVVADGQTYAQVATLRDSEPHDPHYQAVATDDGHIRMTFGDGARGRRLPTGQNNIRAFYRVGAGLAGNLPAGSLAKLASKHWLVDEVRQPLPATGGDERETLDLMRENAPARLRALGRAVSLADYEHLAAGIAGVWHARAFFDPARQVRGDNVTVVVVPAGGGTLGSLRNRVHDLLMRNGLPQVTVEVEPYAEIALEADIAVRVNTDQYDSAVVTRKVHERVLEAMNLRVRRPGQPLYGSELFRIVEAVPGVVNSDVVLFASMAHPYPWRRPAAEETGKLWVIWPYDNQVIHAASTASVTVTATEAFI